MKGWGSAMTAAYYSAIHLGKDSYVGAPGPDQGPEHQSAGPEGQVQEAQPEACPGVGRRHPALPAGLQAQGVHGPQGQPQVCEEGGH